MHVYFKMQKPGKVIFGVSEAEYQIVKGGGGIMYITPQESTQAATCTTAQSGKSNRLGILV